MKFRVEQGEVLVKEAAEHNLVSDIKQDIPKFDTVELRKPFVKSFVRKRTVTRQLINKFKSKVQHH